MKLISPSYNILEQKPGLEGIYEQIETAGRLCYKSKRPKGQTAKDFVDRLIRMKHLAMLEHGTVYLTIPFDKDIKNWGKLCNKYSRNPYSKVHYNNYVYGLTKAVCYITTNLRVLIENEWLDDLQYLCEPTEFHEKRVTVHFVTSIGIGRELLRHRKFSFANESTRYCAYNKDRFGNEIIFIRPNWFNDFNYHIAFKSYPTISVDFFPKYDYNVISNNNPTKEDMFIWNLLTSEKAYLEAMKLGAKPQEAREVLPLATKSELIMTGFISDWKHVFNLRSSIASTGKPHPDMVALIDPLMQEFIDKNIYNEKF